MTKSARRLTILVSTVLLPTLGVFGVTAQTLASEAILDVPEAPEALELHANADTSITISWEAQSFSVLAPIVMHVFSGERCANIGVAKTGITHATTSVLTAPDDAALPV